MYLSANLRLETVLKSGTVFDSITMQSSMHNIDRSEIRTRATEVTGALKQRLGSLGHPAYVTFHVKFVDFKCSIFIVRYWCNSLYNRQYFKYTVITLHNNCLIQSFFICVICKFRLSKWLLPNTNPLQFGTSFYVCRMLLLMSIKRKLIQVRFKYIVTLQLLNSYLQCNSLNKLIFYSDILFYSKKYLLYL